MYLGKYVFRFYDGLSKSFRKNSNLDRGDRFSKYAQFIPLVHPYTAATVRRTSEPSNCLHSSVGLRGENSAKANLSKLESDLFQCCCTKNRGEHGGGRQRPRGASPDRADRRRHLCAHAVHPKAPRDRAPRRPQGHLEPHPGVCPSPHKFTAQSVPRHAALEIRVNTAFPA